jgi:hypothetical protein|tara:strand:- start:929 stop:1102 length:174 start_codon:yes stop_codon:yes gene_type:complete
MKRKNLKIKKLTDRQNQTLQRHSKHHTSEHMKLMKKLMRQGKTFSQSHKIAMKKVGE